MPGNACSTYMEGLDQCSLEKDQASTPGLTYFHLLALIHTLFLNFCDVHMVEATMLNGKTSSSLIGS